MDTIERRESRDLVAYIKTFSPRWQSEKGRRPDQDSDGATGDDGSITHGAELSKKWVLEGHGQQGRGWSLSFAFRT